MSGKSLSRILMLLLAAVYTGATILTVTPSGISLDSAAISGTSHEHNGPGDKMPCKGMPPNCVTDIGCILLVSVPTPNLNFFTRTNWLPVIYDAASEALRGRAIKPALGPPISLA
jgi:hypothetical protein